MVEILATLLRKDNRIVGINVDNHEHKIVQFADDSTIIVGNLSSIKHVLNVICNFSKYAGLKLNMSKTKGIWLGPLKELGLRKYEGLTWTGNPVKCLGIYIGHKHEKCVYLNWTQKLKMMEKTLQRWKMRQLTLEGKIIIIKTLVLSKIIFPVSLLPIPTFVKNEVKEMIFKFLWKGKDKVKRSVLINDKYNGGLNMIDIDSFFDALKASWITRIINCKGKWKSIFEYYVNKQGTPLNYLLQMSFKTSRSFPVIKNCHSSTEIFYLLLTMLNHVYLWKIWMMNSFYNNQYLEIMHLNTMMNVSISETG